LLLDVLLFPSSRLNVSSGIDLYMHELTGSKTYSLCLLINMIEYPGISNTEVGNDLEWLPGVQLGSQQDIQADIPYKLLIVHLGHDEYK